MGGQTRKGSPWLRRLLVEAAHTKSTYLSSLYHRLTSRLGPKKAMVAVGHTILVMIYHLLDRRVGYQE